MSPCSDEGMLTEIPTHSSDAERRVQKPRPSQSERTKGCAAPPVDREDEDLYDNLPCTD